MVLNGFAKLCYAQFMNYEEEAKINAPSPFGVKDVIDIVVTHGELSALVRTAWIVN